MKTTNLTKAKEQNLELKSVASSAKHDDSSEAALTFDRAGKYMATAEEYPNYSSRIHYQSSSSSPRNLPTSNDTQGIEQPATLTAGGGGGFTMGALEHQLRQNTFDCNTFGVRFALIMESLRSSMSRSTNNPAEYHLGPSSSVVTPHLPDIQSTRQRQQQHQQQQSAALLSALNSPFLPAHNLFGRLMTSDQGSPVGHYSQVAGSYNSSRSAKSLNSGCSFSSCNQSQTMGPNSRVDRMSSNCQSGTSKSPALHLAPKDW